MNSSRLNLNNPPQVWITTNSPGELTTWVSPIVAALIKRQPDLRITVALVPCQYASGREAAIASAIPGVETILTPHQTLGLLRRRPWRSRHHRGCVLYLGGDPLYAKGLGFKFSVPVVAYTEHQYSLGIGITHTLRKSDIGDLMGARVVDHPAREPDLDIVFFTGSRPAHFAAFAPFCVSVSHLLPGLRMGLQRSPYISDIVWDHFCRSNDLSALTILDGTSLDALGRTRLLVTLPGSNTAEAMYMRTPMMVVLPLNRPDLIQLDGLVGILGMIPGVGTAIKWLLIQVLKLKNPTVALPNLMAGTSIVPEIKRVVTPEMIAGEIKALIADPAGLAAQREALAQFKPSRDALVRIVDTVMQCLTPR